jgi:hypothetical protein
VKLWTAATGLVRGDRFVLETLAATEIEEATAISRPKSPLIWLTQNALTLDDLPSKSRWVFFSSSSVGDRSNLASTSNLFGLMINPEQTLQSQLQNPLKAGVKTI